MGWGCRSVLDVCSNAARPAPFRPVLVARLGRRGAPPRCRAEQWRQSSAAARTARVHGERQASGTQPPDAARSSQAAHPSCSLGGRGFPRAARPAPSALPPPASRPALASFTRCGLLCSSACTRAAVLGERHATFCHKTYCYSSEAPSLAATGPSCKAQAEHARCVQSPFCAANKGRGRQPASPAPGRRQPRSRCRTERRRACYSARLWATHGEAGGRSIGTGSSQASRLPGVGALATRDSTPPRSQRI